MVEEAVVRGAGGGGDGDGGFGGARGKGKGLAGEDVDGVAGNSFGD